MAAAILMHLVVSTLTAMVLGLSMGRVDAVVAVASLAAGTTAAGLVWRRLPGERRLFNNIGFVTGLFFLFITLAGLEHFLYLLYYNQNGLYTLDLNNFGDLSLHIQYIRHIASGARFWPGDASYAGTVMRYPIGMDLYNALWETLGVPLASHLFLAGLVMTLVTVSLLHRWMGWWGVGAFFLNGGLENWKVLGTGRLMDLQNTVAWKNFFLSLWVPQRGYLFALPAGIYVIKTVTDVLLDERTLSREEKIVCASLWPALAWFNLHAFFIISLTLGTCILLYRKPGRMLGMVVPAAVVGLAFSVFSVTGLSRPGALHLKWDWVANGANFFTFWLVNLGPWLLLAGWALFSLRKKAFARYRPMAAVFFLLFFVFTWVMVAPWDWDNIKVLFWLYLMIAWLIWRTSISRLAPAVALLIGCLVFFPGVVSVISSWPGNANGVRLYKVSETWEAEAALKDVPPDAVLATAPEPNHPAAFWGAEVAMGYPGHLWSHGIDYAEREWKLDRIFRGEADWRSLARDIGITYIYWGESEKRKYGAFEQPWRHELKNVSRTPEIGVYEVASGAGQAAGG
ncbi:MAG: hypothetical protein P8013_03435 [Candidatus Sulfobium sp.]